MTESKIVDTVDTSRYRIEPLTASNYFMWSRKMEIVLRGKGLWDIVSGNEEEPLVDGAESGQATTVPNALLKFRRRQDVALTNLLLTVDDSCSASVISMRDPKEVWDTLKSMFHTISEASIDAYLLQYQSIKMRPGEKVMQYVNRMTVIENKLATIGHAITSVEKKRALLRGLSEDFAITVEVIRATGKNFTEAVAHLVVHEATSDNADSDDEESSTALPVTGKEKCFHCGRKGHMKNKCFHNPESPNYHAQCTRTGANGHRGGRNKNKGNRHRNKDSKKEDNVGSGYVTFVSKCLSSRAQKEAAIKNKWYIDSGASAHMCNSS